MFWSWWLTCSVMKLELMFRLMSWSRTSFLYIYHFQQGIMSVQI